VSSLNNLGHFYYSQKRYREAEPLAVEVLDASRRLVGDDHPDTLLALHNLATIKDELGRQSEAEKLYVKTLEAKRRVLGAEHLKCEYCHLPRLFRSP
jgi:Tfp pilus assembly protein PilF